MKKRIFAVFISILAVIPFVLSTPRADDPLTPVTKDYVITSYGNYKVEVSTVPSGSTLTTGSTELIGVEFSMPIGSGGCSVMFNYIFESERSGTMRLNVTLPLSVTLKSCSFAVAGGRFTNMTNLNTQGTSKIFDIKFQDTMAVSFTLFLPANNTNFDAIVHPITLSNVSIQDGVGLFDIDDSLNQIDNTLDLYIPGMSTYLSNIASNTSNIASDVYIIKGYLDGLEGYTDQIEPYLNQLVNINKINTYPIWQQNSLFWANRYGTLNFDSNLPYFTYLSSNNSSTYTQLNRLALPPLGTYSLIFYSSVNINIADISLYYPSDYQVNISRTYSYTPPSNLFLYRLDFTNPDNALRYFELEISKNANIYPLFWGNKSMIPDDVHLLFGDDYDNTYTRLLQSIYNGINGSYDTSQYDQYEQTIDGLNDSMRDRFNSSETSFQNSINNILTPDQTSGGSNTIFEQFHFNTINGLFTGFLSDIFTAVPMLRYILLFGLLLLVLGVFI